MKDPLDSPILIGAKDPLPHEHVIVDGSGYSLYAAHQPRSRWAEHSHDVVQVTIASDTAAAEATWRRPGGAFMRRKGSGASVSILPPGENHTLEWRKPSDIVHFYLSPEVFQKIAPEAMKGREPEFKTVLLEHDPLMQELGKAVGEQARKGLLSDLYVSSVMNVLGMRMLERYAAQPSSALVRSYRGGLTPSQLHRVRDFVDHHLGASLTIEQLSEQVEMSPHYFAMLFRQSTGFTPHQYVLRRRVERAKDLLKNSSASLSDIAYQLGFSSQAQFTTTFHRFTGETPLRFRKLS
jgi:AraC family transcriptional regulator